MVYASSLLQKCLPVLHEKSQFLPLGQDFQIQSIPEASDDSVGVFVEGLQEVINMLYKDYPILVQYGLNTINVTVLLKNSILLCIYATKTYTRD